MSVQQLTQDSALEAVSAAEAGHEEDDERQDKHDGRNDQLHLHVLPPHLAAQLPPCLVKPIRLPPHTHTGFQSNIPVQEQLQELLHNVDV